MFDINAKIEEIRQQPERIRLRWVYGSVFVSMLFVLFIWVLSVKVNFSGTPVQSPQRAADLLGEGFSDFQVQQQDSLEALLHEEDTATQ